MSLLRLLTFLISGYSIKLMPGSKAPDIDAYGLLRATHSHHPTQDSLIVG